jgi:hypothetical protein
MSDSSSSSSSSSSSEEPKKRAKRSEINRVTLAEIELADKCAHSGAETDNQPTLAEREWTAANQTALTGAVTRANDLVSKIRAARAGKTTRTRDEEDARAELLAALDPILAGGRRTFPEGAGERKLFGVGGDLINASTSTLYHLALDSFKNLSPDATTTPPTPAAYVLRGVLPAEIARLDELGRKYKNSDFAQADAIIDAAGLLDQLTAHMDEVLNPLRRELQFAAEQAWPSRVATNRAKRLAFGLPPNRPMTE